MFGGLEPMQDATELLKQLDNLPSQEVAEKSLLDSLPDIDTGLEMDKVYSPNELFAIKLKNGEIKQSCK